MENDDAGTSLLPINPLWRLNPYLSPREAAALIAGYEPSQIEQCHADTRFNFNFPKFAPALSVLTGAALSGELKVDRTIRNTMYGRRESEEVWKPVGDDISSTGTRIETDTLRSWMEWKGYRQGFFFPNAKPKTADYLDDTHPRYSRKLAASVRAWIDFKELPGKSPKQALDRWLREHAAEFGMTDDEGKVVEAAVSGCAIVANWDTSGGAPKTPGA